MSDELKSGREILDEFFLKIMDIEGVDKDVAEIVFKLFKEDKLTSTNLTNELQRLREKNESQ